MIRRATRDDVETLVDLSIETFTETFGWTYPPADLATFLEETYTVANYERLVAGPDTAVWIAERDGQAIGYVLAGPAGLPHSEVKCGDGEVKRLYVHSSAQGDGIGTELLETAVAWLDRDGPRTLWLGVWSENPGAQRLYQRYGFTEVGAYEFVVGSTRDHELIYRRLPQ